MQSREHWEKVYETRPTDSVSWFQEHPLLSLKLIRRTGVAFAAAIIDVGAGASTLVDDLLAGGYSNLTVLDLSSAAIEASMKRLGPERSRGVTWLVDDIRDFEPADHAWEVWHDRAVFHFLTEKEDRQKYVRAVMKALRPGGFVIIATFSDEGPTRCSGLPAMRYCAEGLHAEFGDAFELLQHEKERHVTPSGGTQEFLYCCFRKLA
ncbi:MAG: class I SAM-dependent methyltransferase [Chlorobiaceae bacterium]|nr:class I SAM-dependent methyltransferase [Chlorobiaceae bacterium]